MYSFFDNKSGRYSAPYVDINEATAVRNFGQAINNNESFRYAPADYSLFNVGVFDSDTGKIDIFDPIKFICNGASVFMEKVNEK